MTERAYYNDNDPAIAAWVRNLIVAGQVPSGDVDERSIADVQGSDLTGYTQCHFFAGIGGWALALRMAGWADDRAVWTGSCPCQPFSAAGKRRGTADKRHLWPEFYRLISERRPAIVFGEQVASANGRLWLSGVRADLEALGYAVGAADLCAAGLGAPHIRQRLYWVADACKTERRRGTARAAPSVGMEYVADHRPAGRLGNADAGRCRQDQAVPRITAAERSVSGPHGFWSAFDIVHCRDGKARRVKPGAFPLVARLPAGVVSSGDSSLPDPDATAEARVMRLRGYGNSLCVPVAAQFVMAYMEAKP